MNRKWLNSIDLDRITLYPIQFANCDRLVNNDAVYIFDEVGCGKTISSGLMAMDYIHNHNKNVLVITTNALIRSEYGMGQFQSDLMYRLPFGALNYAGRITFINNDYRNIEKEKNKDYGLIIIDEAHLFLNNATKRCEALKKLRAEKVVFLTATPIKEDVSDLYRYVNVAKAITGKELNSDWIDGLKNIENCEDLICSRFDVKSPVTRYFKDTIMAINHKSFDETKVARRLAPLILNYEGGIEEKYEKVSEEMLNKLNASDTLNRFVVFVNLVEKEAERFGRYLEEKKGFSRWGTSASGFTYKVVTGKNSYELPGYSISLNAADNKDRNRLPDVLILTYQIAEQGVNLPCYNHVVNMHIPPSPSSLEQRFGRIDRMGTNGSVYRDIYMWFPLQRYYWDTNKFNFYNAISIYRNSLITHLPSKNTIITKEILDDYYANQMRLMEFRDLLKSEQKFDALISALTNGEKAIVSDDQLLSDLYNFIAENDLDTSDEETLRQEVKDLLPLTRDDTDDGDHLKYLIEKIGNKIFYAVGVDTMITADAVKDCAKFISENDNFKDYKIAFNTRVKLSLLINSDKFRSISKKYEDCFMLNCIAHIFNINQHYVKRIFRLYLDKAFPEESFTEEEYDYMFEKSREFPLFRVCELFGELLSSKYHYPNKRNKDRISIRYSVCPLLEAFFDLKNIVNQSDDNFGLSQKFVDYYFKGIPHGNLFAINNENGEYDATEWYKVAYWFTRREKFNIFCEFVYTGQNNIYEQAEKTLLFVSDLYYKNHKDKAQFSAIIKVCGLDMNFWLNRNYYTSCAMIDVFLFTDTQKRKYVKELGMDCPNDSEYTVRPYDYLTAGLINTLVDINWKLSCFFGKDELPEELLKLNTFYERDCMV